MAAAEHFGGDHNWIFPLIGLNGESQRSQLEVFATPRVFYTW